MTDNGPSSDLGRQAAARAAAALRAHDGPSSQGAAPGDVFVLSETSDHAVQWVVLARDPARPGQLLVVAADANPLVGTTDLEVGDDALGPLVVRRPFGGWLDAARFSVDLRVGTLRLDRLSRARDHWFGEVAHGSVMSREVDEDPEYLHWRKTVLQPAYGKLFEVESKPRPWWPVFAAAAAILTTVGGLQIWFHRQQVQGILRDKAVAEERFEGEIQDLQVARQELMERHQVELEEQERLVADYEEKLARAGNDPGLRSILGELRAQVQNAWRSVAVVNPAIAIVRPAGTRGRVNIEMPSGASHVVLFLKIEEDAEDVRYRLELSHADAEEPFWSLVGLEVHSLGEIKVGVPAKIFERGLAYDVRLVVEGDPEVEGDLYQIRIR